MVRTVDVEQEQALLSPAARPLESGESREMFDKRIRQHLGISGDEFLRLWDAGQLDTADSKVRFCAVLIPFGRSNT